MTSAHMPNRVMSRMQQSCKPGIHASNSKDSKQLLRSMTAEGQPVLAKKRKARSDDLCAIDVDAIADPVAHRPRTLIEKPLFALTAKLHLICV